MTGSGYWCYVCRVGSAEEVYWGGSIVRSTVEHVTALGEGSSAQLVVDEVVGFQVGEAAIVRIED
jgi:hypothetical protein